MLDFLVRHKLLNPSLVNIIYLYFQKAFDKVPHQRLLLKLKAHGIGDGITDWIEQWLTDRRQRVIVDGEVSNWKSVLSGVPQGSVLRPLLFLIYINDLDDNITSNLLKFADDTKVFRRVNTGGDKQHLDLTRFNKIAISNKFQMASGQGSHWLIESPTIFTSMCSPPLSDICQFYF